MEQILKNSSTLTPAQRAEYREHLMPALRHEGGFLLKGGHGIYLEAMDGKEYMDFTSEQFTCILGLGNEEIAQAVYEQAKCLTTLAPLHQTDLRYRAFHRIAEIAPKHLNRLSFTVGGGPAIESALKIALKNVPGSRSFVSLCGGYHGTTFGTVNATFLSSRGGVDTPANEWLYRFSANVPSAFTRAPRPYCYRCPFGKKCESCELECAEALKQVILTSAQAPVAAVLVEPVQSGGGQIPFPAKYLKRVREICDELGVLLIFDEIQTFARLGTYFAAEYYDVEPDIIVFAKALGAGIPIAGILIHDRLVGFENLMEDMNTFQNNMISFAAALKTLEIIDRDALLQNCTEIGDYFVMRLKKMQTHHPEIGDIRGIGLAIGIEMVTDPQSREPMCEQKMGELFSYCREHGLFYQLAHNVIKLKPPIIINREEAERAMDILERSFDELLP